MKYRFSDLIDINKLQALMESLYLASKIPCGIIDINGDILISAGWQDICTKFHRVNKYTNKRCQESDSFIIEHLNKNSYISYECKNGLVDVGLPIFINNKHLATIFVGQFFYEKPPREKFEKQAEEFGFDKEAYLEAFDKVPIFNEEQISATMDYYSKLVALLSEIGLQKLRIIQENAKLKKSKELIRQKEEYYQTIYNYAPLAFITWDRKFQITDWNTRAEELFGWTKEEVLGRSFFDTIVPPEQVAEITEIVKQILKSKNLTTNINECIRKDGKRITCKWSNALLHNSKGKVSGAMSLALDITENIESQRQIEEQKQQLEKKNNDLIEKNTQLKIQASAMNAAGEQILIFDSNGIVSFANKAFLNETGYEADEIVGNSINILKCTTNDYFYQQLEEIISRGTAWKGELQSLHKDGTCHINDITVSPVTNDTGDIEHYIAIVHNITEKKKYELKLNHLAHHDSLTGLPNRLQFSDRLTKKIEEAKRNGTMLAVMFLDLDRFKNINDTLGHSIGDKLLSLVSQRLDDCLRDADMLARMGGDEFIIIIDNITCKEDTFAIAKRVTKELSKPFRINNRDLYTSTSIGISIYPTHGIDAETVVKNADSAMYKSKEKGRNSYSIYSDDINAAALQRLNMETSIRKALDNNEFDLHYQPQLNLRTGKLRGVEALIRWKHSEYGNISPGQFIPIAEESGLIVPVDDFVLLNACIQIRRWIELGMDAFKVAVNISGRHLQSEDFVLSIKNLLEQTGVDGNYLEIELTESSLMINPDLACELLHNLKEFGIKISLDDFGTGYSSLGYLKKFPIDVVKIDHTFVKDINNNKENAAIAKAIIAMSHSLNMKVIAEGVETIEQLEFLNEINCDKVQGYFIHPPAPVDQITDLLLTEKKRSMDTAA
ncbi:MAG: EAL domain-containing protein [Armatimonadota bacterium]